ncbi:MAG: M28 family peptidase [Clostridiales bacterium]|nr:M28 family peptidase [Clostridiales bacterium]
MRIVNGTKKIVMLLFIIMALLTTIFACTYQKETSNLSLNSERIMEHLNVLISDEFEGRMIATEGNAKTIRYIQDHFSKIGLTPAGSSFLTDFKTVAPSLKSAIVFQVLDHNGSLVREFVQGKDFKTRFDSFSMGGKFSGNIHLITEHSELADLEKMFDNKAILIDISDDKITSNRFDEDEIIELIKIKRAEVLIYKETSPLNVRDIRIGLKNTYIPARGLILLGVSEEVFNSLVEFSKKGYNIEVDSALTFSEIETHNVLGIIPGISRSRDNYIMIATSFDGLGVDEHGTIHRSITNNATAVATMLEIAETIKKNDVTFDSTIVFAAFNGQHTGFVGINDYARNMIFPHDRTQVIVLENIASNADDPLIIATFERDESTRQRSRLLVNRLSKIAGISGVEHITEFEYFMSQHMAFRHMGTVAGVLTHGHVQEPDTSSLQEQVSSAKVAGNIALGYITEYADIEVIGDIINPFMYMSPFILILVILYVIKFYKLPKSETIFSEYINKILDYPVVSITSLFVVIGLALVLQVRHYVAETTGALYENIEITFTLIITHLLEKIPAMILLIYPFLVILVLVVIVTTIAMIVFAKKSANTYAIITMLITYFSFLFVMMSMFRYEYLVVLPNVLSFNNVGIVIHTIITLVSLLITFIWMAEKNKIEGYDMTHIKVALCYTFVFLTITFVTVAPFLSTDEMFHLMQSGSRVRF